MKRLSLAVVTAFVVLATSLPAAAQFQRPDDAVKYRKGAFFVMGQHFGRIGAMAQGRVPYDRAVATYNAEIVQMMAMLPWAGFVEGTDKGDTRACRRSGATAPSSTPGR